MNSRKVAVSQDLHSEKSHIAFIGIGANLGDAQASLRAALQVLVALPQTELMACSPLYGSAPLGENADGPEYVNAVAQLHTELSAHELLQHLVRIENDFGRVRTYQNAPRTLDLDILLFGDEVIHTPELTIPHPRMTERAFVLLPLNDLNAELSWHNASGKLVSISDYLPDVAEQIIHRLNEIEFS